MTCHTILPNGLCATSRRSPASCPVHSAKRKAARPSKEYENAAEARYWEHNRCVHRGDRQGLLPCRDCGGTVNLPAYSCDVHGVCTELRRAQDGTVVWCGDCSDHKRTEDGQSGTEDGQSGTEDGQSGTGAVQAARKHHETSRSITKPVGTYPVAIIITCHNYGRYLAECVESALATGAAEVLVIDDASTDDTRKVAKSFADRGVRYMRVYHRNVYLTRLDGLRATSGRFAVWLDADDRLPTDYLEKGMRLFGPNVGVVYSDMQQFGDNDERWTMPSPGQLDLSVMNHCHAGCIVRRAAVDTVELPADIDTRVLEDWNVWRRIKKNGWKFQKSAAVYEYRQHGSGRLSRVDPQQYRVTAGLDYETLTLFIPLSGREWAWPRLRDWLESQTWPREQTRLVLCDTSQDARFHALLRHWVAAADYPDVRLYRHDVATPGVADDDRTDVTTRRAVQTAVAAIYRRAAQEIHTDYAVIVEDDVIPPRAAISRLLDGMNETTASVSGAYPHRYQPGVVAWRKIGDCLHGGAGITTVEGNGFGCVLVRSKLLREIAITTDGVTHDYDGAWYHQLGRTHWQAKLNWSVSCAHLEKHDAELTRFVVLAQPRTGSTMLCSSLGLHPDIQMRTEILNAGHQHPELPRTDGRKRLRAAWQHTGPFKAAGFKLLAFQPWDDAPTTWATAWDELVADPFVKVIVLRREDHLAQFTSWKVANTLSHWGEQTQHNRPTISVSEDELRWFKQWNDQLLNERLRHLGQHDVHEVTYEELCGNWRSRMKQVQRFLGVQVRELEQATTKQEPRPLREVVRSGIRG